MKAITLKQPWAHAMFDLELDLEIDAYRKNVENRTWRTDYRGPLAIVAGLQLDHAGLAIARVAYPDELEYGCIVGVVDLTDVHEQGSASCDQSGTCKPVVLGGWAEFSPTWMKPRQHWILTDARPVPDGLRFLYTGFLGIRDLGESIAASLMQALDDGDALARAEAE